MKEDLKIEAINSYATESHQRIGELGYSPALSSEIALAFYAEICGEEEAPRVVFWQDDTREEKIKKLKDVICYQKWGKTPNQYPGMDQVLAPLYTGIVNDDPIGYTRGEAVLKLISKTNNKDEEPIVYFDKMRRYPAFMGTLIDLMEDLEISDEEMAEFDPDFYDYFIERLSAAVLVLSDETAPLDENPVWQKYIADWDDYQEWLDKRRTNQI